MARFNAPGAVYVRPTNNVYTGLSFIGMTAMLVALVYILIRFKELGVF